MCAQCNSALGNEQVRLIGPLAKLFKGQTKIIPAELAYPVARYFQRIGLLMDLESARFDPTIMNENIADTKFNAVYRRSDSYFDDAERCDFRGGEVLQNISILLGKHSGSYGRSYTITTVPCSTRDNYREPCLQRKILLSIKKVTCVIFLGIGTEYSRNEKLQGLTVSNEDFVLDRARISNNLDIKKNLAAVQVYSDGSSDAVFDSPHM